MKTVLNLVVNAVLKILGVLHLDAPNRIVIALSPFLVAGAGLLAADASKLIPGVNLDPVELTVAFVTGAGWMATHLLLWLKGWQTHEDKLPASVAAALGEAKLIGDVAVKVAPESVNQIVHAIESLLLDEVHALENAAQVGMVPIIRHTEPVAHPAPVEAPAAPVLTVVEGGAQHDAVPTHEVGTPPAA